MVRTLKAHRTDALVIVGRVHQLWKLRTDLGFFLNLPSLLKIVASGGDDGVLRRVVRFFEGQKLTVVGREMQRRSLSSATLGDVAPSPATPPTSPRALSWFAHSAPTTSARASSSPAASSKPSKAPKALTACWNQPRPHAKTPPGATARRHDQALEVAHTCASTAFSNHFGP